jgi:hypothetical protein
MAFPASLKSEPDWLCLSEDLLIRTHFLVLSLQLTQLLFDGGNALLGTY